MSLMGLIEAKAAERVFHLTVVMRDDFNELPNQCKIYPSIRLNGFENSLTLSRAESTQSYPSEM